MWVLFIFIQKFMPAQAILKIYIGVCLCQVPLKS